MYAVIFNGNACELSINALAPYTLLLLAPRLVAKPQGQTRPYWSTLSLLLYLEDILMICDFPNTTKKTETPVNKQDTAGLYLGHVMTRIWFLMVMYVLLIGAGIFKRLY